jgi:hypothetical protein
MIDGLLDQIRAADAPLHERIDRDRAARGLPPLYS